MARADTPTLLSLDEYAQIMGINPAHFNQVGGTNIMPIEGTCDDVWFQHPWQRFDRISREEIAEAINEAETEIANFIGFWPAPRFISKEMHRYPKFYRNDRWGGGLIPYGTAKGMKADFGKFIQAGQRAVSLVGTATIAGGTMQFVDVDGDSFSETVRITLTTSLTDVCEIKAYYPGESGDEIWEIRPAKAKAISGGSVTLDFWIWQIVDPDLWESFVNITTDREPKLIDITDTSNFLTSIDVYREYCDFTQKSAEIFWENTHEYGLSISQISCGCSQCGGTGCEACLLTTQDGCIHVRDVDTSFVVPLPATYDDDQASWIQQSASVCREPDIVKLWYYAGDLDQRYLRGASCHPLSKSWAQTIAWLATARLDRPPCGCDTVISLFEDLRRDIAFTPSTGGSYTVSFRQMDSPFGTRKGELIAYNRCSKLLRKIGKGAAV